MPTFIVVSAGSNLKPLIFILISLDCDTAGWVEGALTGGTLAGSAWVRDEFRGRVVVELEPELQAARSSVESNSMVIYLVFILLFSTQMNIHINIER